MRREIHGKMLGGVWSDKESLELKQVNLIFVLIPCSDNITVAKQNPCSDNMTVAKQKQQKYFSTLCAEHKSRDVASGLSRHADLGPVRSKHPCQLSPPAQPGWLCRLKIKMLVWGHEFSQPNHTPVHRLES